MTITNHQAFTFLYIAFTAVPSVAGLSFRLRAADQKEKRISVNEPLETGEWAFRQCVNDDAFGS
jgi:hypothetical protein